MAKKTANAAAKRPGRRSGHNFQGEQLRVFEFAKGVGFDKAASARIARRARGPITLAKLRERYDYFASIKLDPKVYGVERLPLDVIEKGLGVPLWKIKQGIKRAILHPLEDRHAATQLDRLLAGWRDFILLKRIRPATILKNYKAAASRGVLPTPSLLASYSSKSIAEGNVRTRHALDEQALRAQIRRGLPAFDGEMRARSLVVDALVARPHLSASTNWLRRNLAQEHSISPDTFRVVITSLTELGVISSRNGHIRVTKWFRLGTSGLREQHARVEQWLEAIGEKARALEERKRQSSAKKKQ